MGGERRKTYQLPFTTYQLLFLFHHRRRRSAEFLGLGARDQLVDKNVDVAVEHARQVIGRHANAVIGDARLGKVVGADLFAALAAADLRFAVGGLGLLALEL